MSLSLKMLPCKKRRAAVAGPQSPREDGELPGAAGSSSVVAADGGFPAKPAPAARTGGGPPSSGPGVWRGPGEASLKGGRRPPGRPGPGPAQEAAGAKEASAAAPLPEGRGSPEAAAEGQGEGGPSRCALPAVGGSPRPAAGPVCAAPAPGAFPGAVV